MESLVEQSGYGFRIGDVDTGVLSGRKTSIRVRFQGGGVHPGEESGWWGGLGRFLMVPSTCSPVIGRKPSSVRMCFAHPLHYDPFPELWGEPEEEEEEEEEERECDDEEEEEEEDYDSDECGCGARLNRGTSSDFECCCAWRR